MLDKHLDLVIELNELVNLTRIDSREEGLILHIEDSLSALEEMEEAPAGLYGDLGTGGGFPGIPLAIVTGRDTLLIDARKKKVEMLDRIIAELGYEDRIHTYAGRAELLARTRRGEFAVLTARALSKLSVLLELASPLLMQGGRLICYKANVEPVELEHALDLQKQTGMKLIGLREFHLEGEETINRSLYTFEKVDEGTVSLPRQEGAAQKNPL